MDSSVRCVPLYQERGVVGWVTDQAWAPASLKFLDYQNRNVIIYN